MTNEQAINYLKHDCNKMCQDCYPEIGRGGSESCNFCNDAEAYDMAIYALEKQIPYKKPVTISKAKLRQCKCGMCYSQESIKYCSDCGQALDWSEDD